MQPFTYLSADSVEHARAALLEHPHAHLIAGGTTLVDLMKAGVEQPDVVIDMNALPLGAIEVAPDRVRIGALVRNADLADDATIRREFPVLAEAVAAGASGQLRNMATTGGNLLQRTRCSYFSRQLLPVQQTRSGQRLRRDRRHQPDARPARNERCVHRNERKRYERRPRGARCARRVIGANGETRYPFEAFFTLPGSTPDRETVLEHGDVITGVEIAPRALYRQSHYLKLRDPLVVRVRARLRRGVSRDR